METQVSVRGSGNAPVLASAHLEEIAADALYRGGRDSFDPAGALRVPSGAPAAARANLFRFTLVRDRLVNPALHPARDLVELLFDVHGHRDPIAAAAGLALSAGSVPAAMSKAAFMTLSTTFGPFAATFAMQSRSIVSTFAWDHPPRDRQEAEARGAAAIARWIQTVAPDLDAWRAMVLPAPGAARVRVQEASDVSERAFAFWRQVGGSRP